MDQSETPADYSWLEVGVFRSII